MSASALASIAVSTAAWTVSAARSGLGAIAAHRKRDTVRGDRGTPATTPAPLTRLWPRLKGVGQAGQLGGSQADLTYRLPNPPPAIAARTARVPRQFSEKGAVPVAAGNWRRITRFPYSGERADAHIIASHRLHHGRSLAGAVPENHLLTPDRREPPRRRCRQFRTASAAASSESSHGGPYPRMCSAPTVGAGRHRPCAVGLLAYRALRRGAGRPAGGARRSGPCPRPPVGPLGPLPLPSPPAVLERQPAVTSRPSARPIQ